MSLLSWLFAVLFCVFLFLLLLVGILFCVRAIVYCVVCIIDYIRVCKNDRKNREEVIKE